MITTALDQLERAGVHVTFTPRLCGPWAGQHAALVTRWPDSGWTVEIPATAPHAAVAGVLDTVAALRQYGAGNAGWVPGPGGTLWSYF